MSNVIPFTFNHRKQIRAILIEGVPYFVAKDVALLLGYQNTRKAVKDHCRYNRPVGGGPSGYPLHGLDPQTIIIPESDMYRLVMRSTLPDAVEIQDWVVEEVLPSLRKTGSYNIPGMMGGFSVPQTMAEALRLAADQSEHIAKLEHEAAEAMPKVQFHDAVAESADCHTLEEAAKMLGTGRNRLSNFLRESGAFQPRGTLPYQKYIDRGYFRIIERPWTDSHGETRLSTKTLITGKGLAHIQRKWREQMEKAA